MVSAASFLSKQEVPQEATENMSNLRRHSNEGEDDFVWFVIVCASQDFLEVVLITINRGLSSLFNHWRTHIKTTKTTKTTKNRGKNKKNQRPAERGKEDCGALYRGPPGNGGEEFVLARHSHRSQGHRLNIKQNKRR